MLDWSKSFEMYLKLSNKQRLSIGQKAHVILAKEIENLVEEEYIRPSLYLLSLGRFISLREEYKQEEYNFFKDVTGYSEPIETFELTVNNAKDKKIGEFLEVYFQKLGGEALTAYLSFGLALMTIKGELTEDDKALIEKIHG